MVIIRILGRTKQALRHNVRQLSVSHAHVHKSTVDTDDVRRHSFLADDWWNPAGPMKALHSLNKIR